MAMALTSVRFAINAPEFNLLRKRLERLPGTVQNKVGARTLRKMAVPFVRAIRANILGKTKMRQRASGMDFGSRPGSVTGNLKKSIGSVLRRYSGKMVLVVGPKRPLGAHGHLVEFGHQVIKATRSSGVIISKKIVGQARPHPFLGPAFNSTKHLMESIRTAELTKGIEAAAKAG